MNQLISYLSLILILPLFSESQSLAQSTGSGKKNMESNDTVFFPDWEHNDSAWVDWLIRPEFPGGEEALIVYIKNYTAYPETALKDSIEGRVIIKCVIDTKGSTSNISTLRSVRSDLDSECIRVIQKMPKFKPGSDIAKAKKGWYIHNVNVWYMLGINFSIHKNDNEKGIFIHPK